MNRILLVVVALALWPMYAWSAPIPTINLLDHTYQLGSYNQKSSPMWEFVCPPQTVDNWTSLVTVLDCPNAHTLADVDSVAQGILNNYKQSHAQILMSKTMRDKSGAPYDYMVAAFDETARHRYELDFVKVALAGKNAFVLIYGARITDPKDYRGKAKAYLSQHSGEIGRALESVAIPPIDTLPRKVF